MLNLKNFEKYVSDYELRKGKETIEQQNILFLNETQKNFWISKVSGSNDYHVQIKLNDDQNILEHSCDCPYEGNTCRHQVGVFLKIRQRLADEKIYEENRQKEDKNWNSLTQSVSKEDLIRFFNTYSIYNPIFKKQVQLFFASKIKDLNIDTEFKELFEMSFRKYLRMDYVDSVNTKVFLKKVGQFKSEIETDYTSYNNMKALSLCLLREVATFSLKAEDKQEEIPDFIQKITSSLERILQHPECPQTIKEQIYNQLLKELERECYYKDPHITDSLLNILKTSAKVVNREFELPQLLKEISGKTIEKIRKSSQLDKFLKVN